MLAFLTAHWFEIAWGALTLVGLATPPESKLGTFARALAVDLANKNAKAMPKDALERLAADMTAEAAKAGGK
jgi:uncharacterized membrane protein YphA (DoxX/SURF4 family)